MNSFKAYRLTAFLLTLVLILGGAGMRLLRTDLPAAGCCQAAGSELIWESLSTRLLPQASR